MKFDVKTVAILLVVVVIIGVGVANVMGVFRPTATQARGQGQGGGQGSGTGRTALRGATVTPNDIRGSSTLGEISEAFGVSLNDLTKAFGVDSMRGAAGLASKDIKEIYAEQKIEIGNGSVKWFVALYKNVPHQLTEETYLPAPAVEILKARKTLTPDQTKYLDAHVVPALKTK